MNIALEAVHEYSFFQINALLKQYCRVYNMSHDQPVSLHYRALASLGFPTADVKSVIWKDGGSQSVMEIDVSFMGLYGPSSPLPVYYTERVLECDSDGCPSQDLMDLLNHHMIGMLQRCWEKYRYYIQYQSGACDQISNWLLLAAGLQPSRFTANTELKVQRLLPFVGLLRGGGCSADLLCKIMANYFQLKQVTLEPWVERVVDIPKNQQCMMGMGNCRLGDDLVVGDALFDRSGKFEIHLQSLNHEQYVFFLPWSSGFKELQDLVDFLIDDALEYDLCLSLSEHHHLDDEPPRMHTNYLGWNEFLGGQDQASEHTPTRICVSNYRSF